jgi:hypothetical protein
MSENHAHLNFGFLFGLINGFIDDKTRMTDGESTVTDASVRPKKSIRPSLHGDQNVHSRGGGRTG